MLILTTMACACVKSAERVDCAAGTLLIKFDCGEDMRPADRVSFNLAKEGDAGKTFTTDLPCPASRLFQVRIPGYQADQKFAVSYMLMQGETALQPPSAPIPLSLLPSCTPVQINVVSAQDAGVDDGGMVPPGSRDDRDTCGADLECKSGFCADGVCCSTRCEGTCSACNLPDSLGKCTSVPLGVKPSGAKQCSATPKEKCGLDGTCDGAGMCASWADGTVCAAGECEGSGSRNRKVCGAGECKVDQDLVCAPFLCNPDTKACFDGCDTNAQCNVDKKCEIDPQTNKKSCGKKPLGAACEQPAECESSSCANGVCCGTACEGACQSCNQVGNIGKCLAVAAGVPDPRQLCAPSPVDGCGLTGKCNGIGACAKYSNGTVCRAASCSASELTPAGSCDGNGSCLTVKPVSCAPFVCSANECGVKCTADTECTTGTSCVNGSCGLRPPVAACTLDSQCASGFCADGVCCDSACKGACEYCASPSAKGKCISVPAGTEDPRHMCAPTPAIGCGTNGKCDGKNACEMHPPGTECKAKSCSPETNKETFSRQCDGKGSCLETKADRSCAPFTCSGSSCGISCSRSDECTPPNTCASSACGKLAQGQACGTDSSKCASGFCAQGVCCLSVCTETCKSCAVSGSEGTCVNVPDKQDLRDQCAETPSTSCGTTGTCDGGGKCAVYAAGTNCAQPMCSADTAKSIGASSCNGAGSCVAPAEVACSNSLMCGGSPAGCKSACSGDGDCLGGTKCNVRTGKCAKANGGSCSSGNDCGSDKCVDQYCCNSGCSGTCEACSFALTGVSNGQCAPTKAGVSAAECPPTVGPGDFFLGTEMTVAKLVAADSGPGYFFTSQNAPAGPVVESVTDAALPSGTKYAMTFTLDPSMTGNFTVGWHWRQNGPGNKWSFFDASAFAGVSFWVKGDTTSTAVVFTGYYQFDDTSFTAATEQGGNCAAEPCPPITEYASVVARKSGWTRIVQRFSHQTSGTPNLKAVARVELLQLRLNSGGPASKLLLTRLQLLKEADLPPP